MKAAHTIALLLILGAHQSVALATATPAQSATSYATDQATEVFVDAGAGPASCPDYNAGAPVQNAQSAASSAEAPPAEAPQIAAVEAAPAPEAEAPAAVAEAPVAPKPAPRPKVFKKADGPLTTWWNASGEGLKVLFVGGAAFSSAIVVLTDGSFTDPAVADREIKVRRLDGSKVSGKWKLGPNNKMLVLQVPPGRYHVAIGAGLRDGSDRTIAQASDGAVFVQ